jgi:hypothetical protein
VYHENIRNWLSRINKRLNTVLGKQNQTVISRKPSEIAKALIEYFKTLGN